MNLGDLARLLPGYYRYIFTGKGHEVEHSMGWVRRYQALSQTGCNHLKLHQERVEPVSGLANH